MVKYPLSVMVTVAIFIIVISRYSIHTDGMSDIVMLRVTILVIVIPIAYIVIDNYVLLRP